MLIVYVREALIIVLIVSGLPLAVGSIAGLAAAVLQAATQIQEQSISYCARFVSVGIVGVFLGEWFEAKIVEFFQVILASVAAMGRLP